MKRLALFLVIGILLLTACNSPTPEVVEDTATTEPTVEVIPTEVPPTELPPTEPAPTAAEMPTTETGADGIGDPYFPQMGNGGYDVQHYTIKLDVNMEQRTITGTTTLEVIALQDMSAFNLDFFGLDISEIRLDDSPVEFSRDVGELTIIPSEPLAEGQSFTVDVDYSGTPGENMPEDIPGYDFGAGWNFYEDGVYVAGEPLGSSNWYPVNEHPRDKALYTYKITVSKPYVVAANGLLQDTIEEENTVTYIWESQYPMASYLVTVNIAEFDVEEETGPDGLPIRNYFQQDVPFDVRAEFDVTADAIEFYNEIFGPYPFEAYGAVVHDIHLGFALETQTISIFGSTFATEEAIVHELAHQWFGDSISLEEWEDIWLNEGFATYASILWTEHRYGEQAAEEYIEYLYNALAGGVVGVFDKATLVGIMNTLVYEVPEGTVLSPERVEMALDALVGDVVSEEDIEAAIAQVPEEGISPDEFPSVLNTLDFVQTELRMDGVIALEWAIGLSETEPTDTTLIIGSPPADNLFDSQVYDRGALTLHALRLEVGDDLFFEILRTYYDQYQGGNASIEDFIAVAEEVSGQELDDLFDAWLYQEVLPDMPEMGLYRENFER